MKLVTAARAAHLSPRMIEFLEVWNEVEKRNERIKQLEKLNAKLAKRIDELEAERKR